MVATPLRSDFFIALCPVLSNPGETETFSEHSWAYRGWCRVERMVYELTFNQGAVNGQTNEMLKRHTGSYQPMFGRLRQTDALYMSSFDWMGC